MQRAVTFPTFIIIGAERCGTTTVHHSLTRHPQVLMSVRKEPNYWLFDKHGRAPAAMTQQQIVAMEKRSGRTRRDYDKMFEGAGAQHVAIGEASPCYLRFPHDVAPRLRAELPEVKLITILRQPLDHARSVLAMWLGRSPSAAEMIDALHTNQRGPTGGPALPVLGRFADYLRPYFAVFPREQIKVLLFDRIESDLLSEVQTFIGVTPMKLPNLHLNCSGRPKYPLFGQSLGLKLLARSVLSDRLIRPLIPIGRGMQAANMSRVPPNLPPALQTVLTEKFYGRSISDLETLVGLDLSAWRIQEGLATEPDRRLDQTFRSQRHRLRCFNGREPKLMALTMVIRRPVAVPVSILVQDTHADAPEVGFLPDAQQVLNQPCHGGPFRLSPENHKPAASIPNHSGIFSVVGSGACRRERNQLRQRRDAPQKAMMDIRIVTRRQRKKKRAGAFLPGNVSLNPAR